VTDPDTEGATFWCHDDIDRRWHQLRTWHPDTDLWTIWCQPDRPRRLAEHTIVTEPGLPLCQDCRSAQHNAGAAARHLTGARAAIQQARRVARPIR
jgi:hypothetical protein